MCNKTCNMNTDENVSTNTVGNNKKKKGANWSEKETNYFIRLCIEKRILHLIDGKHYKHIDVYKSLEIDMKEAGFIKSGAQMQVKMKHLKEIYYKCKRNNSISGHDRMSFQYFDLMNELLGSRPSVQAIDGVGIESSASERKETEENQELVKIIQGTEDDAQFIAKDAIVEVLHDDPAPQIPSTSGKKRQKTEGLVTGGRKSNVHRVEQFSETFVKKQTEMFHDMFKTQTELLEKSLQTQMEEQRKWEAEMMKKEHEYQMLQMNMLMDGFLRGLQTMQHQPSFHPTLQLPGFSPYSSQTSSFMRNPSPSSISLSHSSNSMSPQTSFVSPVSPSLSATSDCISYLSPSSSPKNQLPSPSSDQLLQVTPHVSESIFNFKPIKQQDFSQIPENE